MARASLELGGYLREAADRLRKGAHYAWGHHGACNCGHLCQVITSLSEKEILQAAHGGTGEWSELGAAYCGDSKASIYNLLTALQDTGLTPTDIHHLEYLSDKEILHQLPGGFRWLKKNIREDVILYFETFATILEEKYLQMIPVDLEKLIHSGEPVNS